MFNKQQKHTSLTQLVQDFEVAFNAVSTVQTAEYIAEQSEATLLQDLGNTSQSAYLQPSTLDPALQQSIVQASLDAHVKKLQAHQLSSMGAAEISRLHKQDHAAFVGKKVSVSSLLKDTASSPFDAVWFSPQTGYRTNPYNKTSIKGTIEEVLLDKNLLVIKPPKSLRIINNDLYHYFVYVINPSTGAPAVTIE